VLAVAQVAGVMGAKKTPDLIPMCHPILLTSVDISFKDEPQPDIDGRCSITITATAKTTGPTGVEMEALMGVTVALLTIYDMCKAVDKQMAITEVRLAHPAPVPERVPNRVLRPVPRQERRRLKPRPRRDHRLQAVRGVRPVARHRPICRMSMSKRC